MAIVLPSKTELLETNVKDLYIDSKERQELIQEIAEIGQVTGKIIQLRQYDGTPIWVEDHTLVVGSQEDQIIFEGALIDITERKYAEEALTESEERYRNLFESVPVGLFRTTSDGQIMDANQALVNMFGYPSRAAFLNTKVSEHYVNQDDRAAYREVIEREGSVHALAFQQRRYDGEIIWTEGYSQLVQEDDGQQVYDGALIDITERKRAEQALSESEARYRNLVENINDIIYRYEFIPESRFAYVSPSVTRITGYTPAEHYADPQLGVKLVHPEDQPQLDRVYDLEKDEVTQSEVRWIRKDGRVIWTEQTNTPIFDDDGNFIAVEGMARDITDRKQAELRLQESEAQFRAIFNNAPITIAQVDFAGHPIVSNQAAQNMFGYSADELATMVFTEFTHPEDAEIDLDFFQELVAGKRDQYQLEKRYIRKNGEIIHGNLFVSLIRDEHGTPKSAIGMVEDITERKQAEIELKNSEERYRRIYENASVGLGRTRFSDGKFIQCNERLAQIMGYASADECIANFKTSEHYVDPDMRANLLTLLKQQGEVVNFPAQMTRADGQEIWIEFSLRAFPEKGYIEGVIVDITDRKQAEEAQQKSQQQLQDMVDHTPAVVYAKDLSGRYILVNQEWRARIGLGSEDVIGKTAPELFPKTQDTLWNSGEQHVIETGEALVSEDIGHHTDRSYLTTKYLLREANGEPYALGNSSIDITERKVAEETLRNYANRLEILHKIDQGILAAQSPSEIAQFALGHLRDLIPCQRASVTLHYPEFLEAELIAVNTDVEISDKAGSRLPIEKDAHYENFINYGIVQYSIADQELYEGGFHTYLHCPLLAQNELVGVVNLGFFEPENLSEEHHTIIRQVADQLAIALQQARLMESETIRRLEAEALRAAGEALNSTLNLDEVLDRILDNLDRVVPHDAANITTIEGDATRVVRQRGYDKYDLQETVEGWQFVIKNSAHYVEMIATQQPVVLPDTHALNSEWSKFWVRSYAGAPLRQRGEIIGFLNVDSKTPHFFNAAHAKRLQSFADQAAIALENARLLEEAQENAQRLAQQVSELEAMARLAIELRSANDRQEVIHTVVGTLYDLFQAAAVSINTLDPTTGEIVMELSRGPDGDKSGVRLESGSSMSHQIIKTQEVFLSNDTHSEKDKGLWTRTGPRPSAVAGFPLIADQQAIGALWLSRNTPITPTELNYLTTMSEMVANTIHRATLTQAEIKRRQEAETLAQVTAALTQTLDLEEILESILTRLARVVPFDSSTVFLIEADYLLGVAARGLSNPDKVVQQQFPLNDDLFPVIRTNQEAMVISDAQNDPRFSQWGGTDYVRGWLGVPLIARDEVIGFISLDSKTVNAYGVREATLAQAFANQAAAAIQNGRLLAQVQRHAEELEQRVLDRTQELSILFEVAAVANTTTDLDTTIQQVLSIIATELKNPITSIFLLNDAENALSLVANIGLSPEMVAVYQTIDINSAGLLTAVVRSRKENIAKDVATDARASANAKKFNFGPFAGFPLRIEGTVTGVVAIVRPRQKPEFSADEINLMRTVADQVSSIIASAQLRAQAESAAILEERQRLARDLHDAVSQTLFSASVIAQTLDRLWERGPELVRANLVELQKLTQGALAEMRNLLLELRPAALENAAMTELLQQLAAGFAGRTRAEITVSIDGQEPLPFDSRVAFFRLAQEALNNIIKHARAQQVFVHYDSQIGQASLRIQDDGRGFDLADQPPGHHGLAIMQERAEAIGAELEIASQPGKGTMIQVRWMVVRP